jgi:predicted  nucleic acid-binding Zn-ribbon protein
MILVSVLGSALLLALGFMLHALLKKQGLSTEVNRLRSTQEEAITRAEKTTSRVTELERKLVRARSSSSEIDTAKESLEASIQKLEEENRQLRNTMERTASRATPAQIDDAKELQTDIDRLQGELTTMQAQLTTSLEESKHLEKQVASVRDTVEREAAGASAAYQERVEQIVERFHSMKKRLIHAEHELRVERRLADNNNRAYHITLKQLDLAQDQVHSLQTGSVPDQRKSRLLQSLGLPRAPLPSDANADSTAADEQREEEADESETNETIDTQANAVELVEEALTPTDKEASPEPESSPEDTDNAAASANAA